ncbi:hypothetical protein FRB99_002335 [Tulasnella sp. 403]|nr:hypothetical protein FRB99_002335 [Tulasnella sp. 403]
MKSATPEAIQDALSTLISSINKQNETSHDLRTIFEDDPSNDTIPLLDQWMDTLGTAVESLQQCVEARKYTLRKRRNAILPIHSLPEEIFRDILTHVVDTYSDPVVPHLQRLASVSTHWWSTVVSTPSLWTLVHNLDNFELVLRKSAQCTLRVVHTENQQTVDFFTIVGQHAERWRSLRARQVYGPVVGQLNPLHVYAPYIQRSLDSLEELEIIQCRDEWVPLPPVVDAQRLHHVHLERIRLDATTRFTNLSVFKLIQCTGVPLPALVRMLASSPLLEELNVRSPRLAPTSEVWMDSEAGSLDDLPPFRHLRILRLGGVCMGVVLRLLRRVHLENLTKLELVHYFDHHPSFDPFLQSSSQNPMSYRSLITAAFTRSRIRCVKMDLVAANVNLTGSRTIDRNYPVPGAMDTDVEVHFYNMMDYQAGIEYLLPITEAIRAPLFLRFDPGMWIPDRSSLLKLPSLSRMAMSVGTSLGVELHDMFIDLASPQTESNGEAQWLCPQLSSCRITGMLFDRSIEGRIAQFTKKHEVKAPSPHSFLFITTTDSPSKAKGKTPFIQDMALGSERKARERRHSVDRTIARQRSDFDDLPLVEKECHPTELMVQAVDSVIGSVVALHMALRLAVSPSGE